MSTVQATSHALRDFARARYGALRWYTQPAGMYQALQALLHVGWRVECPYCGWRGRSFYPHPSPHPRPNALCPRCFSKERHRFLYLYLRRETPFFYMPSIVLEFAPEAYSNRLFQTTPHVRRVTLDLSSMQVDALADITALPGHAQAFNYIFCFHVLEHVPDDRRALCELHRVLKPGGQLLVHVPVDGPTTAEDASITDPAVRRRLYGQEDHVRAYGRDVVDRFTAAGFVPHPRRCADMLSPHEIARYGLLAADTLYVCLRTK